jgi:hypothetical protein
MTKTASQTPLQRFMATYTPRYRILLILSTLAALVSLAGIGNVSTAIDFVDSDPLYAISGLLSINIVPIFMIASLFLLWSRHPVGIRLRLVGYGISIATSICGFFISSSTLETIVTRAAEIAGDNPALTAESAARIAETSFYGALYISIVSSAIFALLWLSAWKKQIKSDTMASKKQ